VAPHVSVLSAGEAHVSHPTQGLLDALTVYQRKQRFEGLVVALVGDIRHSRVARSAWHALRTLGVSDFALVAPPALMPERDEFAGCARHTQLAPGLKGANVVMMLRIQKERIGLGDLPQGEQYFAAWGLTRERLGLARPDAIVMHPLPRTDELAYELDSDPRAVYFEQAAAGVPVRMALIAWLLEQNGTERMRPVAPAPAIRFKAHPAPRCSNPGCISRHEGAYLVPRFRLGRSSDPSALALVCEFCERDLKVEFVGNARTHRYYRFDRNLYGYVRSWIEEGSLAAFESVKQAEESGYEPYRRGPQREIMNAEEVAAACRALATQMVADLPDLAAVTIVGVVSHGAMLAMRLRDLIEAETRVRPPCAALDVFGGEAAFHPLDDGAADLEVEDRTIVLVDDVINSGWTVQRAMTALWQRGRPAAVKLAVLIDRGHRAVPIRPNYVGKNIPTARAERVQVRLAPPQGAAAGRAKGQDRVVIYSMVESLKEGEGVE